jgi:hypothetical protein
MSLNINCFYILIVLYFEKKRFVTSISNEVEKLKEKIIKKIKFIKNQKEKQTNEI